MSHLRHSTRISTVGFTAMLAITASLCGGLGIQPLPAAAARQPIAIEPAARRAVSAAVTSTAGPCRAEGWTPVSRTSVVRRGKKWVKANVPYDQGKCHHTAGTRRPDDQYRTDCSGFVSMVWALDASYTTADFAHDRADRWHTIKWKHLKPGDAIVAHTQQLSHIVLFVHWEDSDQTQLKAYEEKGEQFGTVATVRSVPDMQSAGYHPIRYDQIEA